MASMKRTMAQNVGKWGYFHTKSGTYYGKLESVSSRGITLVVPSHYQSSAPIKSLESNVKADANVAWVWRRGGFNRWFIPFWFILPLFFFI